LTGIRKISNLEDEVVRLKAERDEMALENKELKKKVGAQARQLQRIVGAAEKSYEVRIRKKVPLHTHIYIYNCHQDAYFP